MNFIQKKIYSIIATSFLLVFLHLGPYGTKELNKLIYLLKEHREKNIHLKIELQCLADIANHEHEEKKADPKELNLLIKSVFSYLNNPYNSELSSLIR